MRYHKKSNQGRFSRKQKKASRIMMFLKRGGFQKTDPTMIDMPKIMRGFLPALITMLFRGRNRG